MQVVHYIKSEVSGLYRTALEMCQAEMDLGHSIVIKEPQGKLIAGKPDGPGDIHVIHSQYDMSAYKTTREEWGIHISTPVFMVMHGEIISSVGNRISMKAICDLASLVDAFICMRKEEQRGWNLIKRCYYVGKGVDLNIFKPSVTIEKKLEGNPAVLYYESWRGSRNPIILCEAMELVHKKYPEACLHLYNVSDQQMLDQFKAYIQATKAWRYIRTLQGPVDYKDVPRLINQADIVASCLFPLYARTPIEALACGKPGLCPGYPGDPQNDYPYRCTLNDESMAAAIIDIHEHYHEFDYRAHAEKHHDVRQMVANMLAIYEGYLNLGRSTGMSLVRAS